VGSADALVGAASRLGVEIRPARLRRTAGLLAVSLALGTAAGMATFVALKQSLAPAYAGERWAVALVVAAGAATPFLVGGLRASVVAAIAATGVALLVHASAWVAPLFLLDYPVAVRDLLLPRYVGRALLSALLVLPLAYGCGYLLGVVVDGYAST